MYLIGDYHNHREGHNIQFLAHFDRELRRIMFLQWTVVTGERPCWIYQKSNRKMDGLGVSGMSILGGIDATFGYLALLDPKL